MVNFHNGAEFLNEALSSISRQTYRNFEVILCNNSSTDSSLDIVDTIITNDPRFKLFHTPQFCSLGKARNIALKNAHGDYIAFLDSDDESLRLGTIVDLKNDGSNSGLFASGSGEFFFGKEQGDFISFVDDVLSISSSNIKVEVHLS